MKTSLLKSMCQMIPDGPRVTPEELADDDGEADVGKQSDRLGISAGDCGVGKAWEIRGRCVNFLQLPGQVTKAEKCGLTEPSRCLGSRREPFLASFQLSGL